MSGLATQFTYLSFNGIIDFRVYNRISLDGSEVIVGKLVYAFWIFIGAAIGFGLALAVNAFLGVEGPPLAAVTATLVVGGGFTAKALFSRQRR